MKAHVSPAIVSVAAIFALACAAYAEVSPIRMLVQAVNKSDKEKFTKTQTRSLKLSLTNSSKAPADVVAKYYFFGRDEKSNDIVTLESGDKPVTIPPGKTELVETPSVTSTSEEAHSSGSSSGRYNSNSSAKKVEASGTKIIGHAVQVFVGEKMVAEAYEPLSTKEQIGKAPAAAKKK